MAESEGVCHKDTLRMGFPITFELRSENAVSVSVLGSSFKPHYRPLGNKNEHLLYVPFTYRTCFQRATAKYPLCLLYGHDARLLHLPVIPSNKTITGYRW